ncbi:MAG: TRAFs-binding domain-containing protein [Spirochaetota bacterium]
MEEGSYRTFEDYLRSRAPDIETAIHEVWSSRSTPLWSSDPRFYIRLGETADRLGQAMFAHDILMEGLEHFPDDLRLNQLNALSLIKCGFLDSARRILAGLVDQGHRDEETLGILGRVYKDMWIISGGASGDRSLLDRSRSSYLEAFQGSGGYYSGINAASLSRMCGDDGEARRLSRRVLGICLDRLKGGERDYWLVATVGEGLVLLQRYAKAARFLALARKLAGKNYSWLASTRKQLHLLRHFLDIPDQVLDPLRVPPVVAFTGHMLDRPGRKKPRFPGFLAEAVKQQIAARLRQLGAGIGYSSAACGSDVLFLECLQERRAETNVILPFDREEFMRASVDHGGPAWRQRAERTLKNATVVLHATEGMYLGDDLLFDYANRMIMGKTLLRAEVLDAEPVLMAVWDRKRDNNPGGTASFIRLWEQNGRRLEIIDLRDLLRNNDRASSPESVPRFEDGEPADPSRGPHRAGAATSRSGQDGSERGGGAPGGGAPGGGAPGGKPRRKTPRREVRALLFADIAGFSRIGEEQIPGFMNGYLGTVAGHLKKTRHRPVFRNIWGDAFYFVFNDILPAARYALELRDLVQGLDWAGMGLPGELSIRIGLHAGPVFRGKEPILNKTNFFGTHVNRAARIEPITSPGNVYASEQFAALLQARGSHDLVSRYVGIIVLPKRFGRYPIYHIKRRMDLE